MSQRLQQALHYSRRTFLCASSLSALGSCAFSAGLASPVLNPKSTFAAPASTSHRPTAKSCILLYMIGGPPQQDTFDLKPDASAEIRGEFRPISTVVSGLQICEHLPKLAKVANLYSLIRSMHHDGGPFHAHGVHYNLTGWKNSPREGQPLLSRSDSPSIGSVLNQLEGRRNPHRIHDFPTAIQFPSWITQDGPGQEWAGQHAGFLGKKYDPLFMDYKGDPPGNLLPDFVPTNENVGPRFDQRIKLLHAMDKQSVVWPAKVTQALSDRQREALDVLRSSSDWRAFCIDEEKPEIRERYGGHHFGRSCLVARRLVEKGVRLVTVTWPITEEFPHFDTHATNYPTMRNNLPAVDQGIAALLEDLRDRGLLEDTLVVYLGEFGRTPMINPRGGRDHWPEVYTTMLAGGGIQGGQVYGSSDKHAAMPKDNPVHTKDFVATIYHALGYDQNTRVVDFTGRPHFIVHGRPVTSLFG